MRAGNILPWRFANPQFQTYKLPKNAPLPTGLFFNRFSLLVTQPHLSYKMSDILNARTVSYGEALGSPRTNCSPDSKKTTLRPLEATGRRDKIPDGLSISGATASPDGTTENSRRPLDTHSPTLCGGPHKYSLSFPTGNR